MIQPRDSKGGGRLAVLGEAVFLACSWTWCIGMFLPVLLVRDFGVMGWVVFAVPNCLGAALMGAVLGKRGAVERVLREHAHAVRAFTLVTTAFQWFFAAWLLQTLGLSMGGLAALAVFIGVLTLTPGEDRVGWRVRAVAAVVLAASLALGAAWLLTDQDRVPLASLPAPLLERGHLPPLAAVCTLGFLLCPYLDITFLRSARRVGTGGGAVAFLAGFLVLFPLMIGLTLLYAPTLVKGAADAGTNVRLAFVPWLIAFHMVAQLAFTIAAHEKAAASEYQNTRLGGENGRIAAFIAGVLLAYLGMRLNVRGVMGGNEVMYRCFMSFYGLVFPAYVWTCAWPLGESGRPNAAKLALACAAIAAAALFYWWGFLDQRTQMLWYGVGIVLAAGLIARFLPGRPGRDGAGVPAPLDPGPDALVAHAVPGRAGDPASP